MEQAKRKAASARKHYLMKRHHMTVEQYAELLESQGGVCYMCMRANGATKALAVDHDHAIARNCCRHEEHESCINCWRGLLCGPCNDTHGHARDDVMFYYRSIDYLRNPPARRLFGGPKQMQIYPSNSYSTSVPTEPRTEYMQQLQRESHPEWRACQ